MTQEDALELLENTSWSLGGFGLSANNWSVYIDFFRDDHLIFEYKTQHVASFPITKKEKLFLWFKHTVVDRDNPLWLAYTKLVEETDAKDQLVFNEEVKESLKLIKNGKPRRISSEV